MDDRPLPLLGDLLALPVRHWRRLVAGALLGAVAGALVFWALPQRFHATSRVAMSPQLTYVSLNEMEERDATVTLDTMAALLGSDAAITAVATAMGVSADEARGSMTVTAKPLSRVLVVRVSSDARTRSAAGVNAATEQLLSLQSEELALDRDRVRLLKNRISVLRAQAQERAAEGTRVESLQDLVDILDGRLERAVATNNTSSVVIQRSSVVRSRPGQAEVFLASGAAIGLLVALGSTRLGDRPRTHPPGRRTGRGTQR